jgi:NTP-dependent ternary system trypsin peptidase co-occuring protein
LQKHSRRGTIGLEPSRLGATIAAELHIPLAHAIRALRRELVEAVRQGTDEEVKFALGPVELELQVEASKEAGGQAGIAFGLVTIGGKGSRSSATTHTIKLSLSPVSATGEGLIVRSQVEGRPD